MGLGTLVGHPETARFKEPCYKVGNPESVARTTYLPHEKTQHGTAAENARLWLRKFRRCGKLDLPPLPV